MYALPIYLAKLNKQYIIISMQTKIKTSIIVNLIKTITLTLFSFLTFPWVCRILTDSQLGVYSWCVSFVYYFLILARISIPNIAVRECVRVKDDPNKLSMKVQEFFILQAILTISSFILLTIITLTVPIFRSNSDYIPLIFILSINFLSGVFSFEWVFEALEKHIYLSIRSIIITAIIDILIFVFVRYPSHIEIYASINVLLTVLTVASNLIYLPKLVKFKKTEKYNFKQYFPTLFTLFIISFLVAVYDKTDTFILGIIDPSKASVGSYAVGIKAIEIVIGVITALGTVFMPRAVKYYENDLVKYQNLNKYSANIGLIIVIPLIAIFTGLAKPITSLICGNYANNLYKDADKVLIILCSLMVTYSLSHIIYTQILIPSKKEKYYMLAMGTGFILNIGFSLLFGLVLFRSSPAFGVALGTSLVDFIVLVFLIIFTHKYSIKMIFNINNLKILIAGIAIGLLTYFVSPLLISTFNNLMPIQYNYLLVLIIMTLIDGIMYLLSLFIAKEKLIRSIVHK